MSEDTIEFWREIPPHFGTKSWKILKQAVATLICQYSNKINIFPRHIPSELTPPTIKTNLHVQLLRQY